MSTEQYDAHDTPPFDPALDPAIEALISGAHRAADTDPDSDPDAEWEPPQQYILLFEGDGSLSYLAMEALPILQRAAERVENTGGNPAFTAVPLSSGEEMYVFITERSSWIPSTLQTRDRDRRFEAARKAERGPEWDRD